MILTQIYLALGIIYATRSTLMSENLTHEELKDSSQQGTYMKILNTLTSAPIIENERFQELLDQRIKMNSYAFIFYRMINGENVPIGIGSFLAEPKISSKESIRICIEDIAVSENYQRQGYGSKIMKALLEIASKRFTTADEAVLTCSTKNIKFYESLKFIDIGGAMEMRLPIVEHCEEENPKITSNA